MRKFVLALVLFGLVSTSIQWKLNVPRVLLPLTEEGAYYKLFSEGGCFDWKSSRPEVSTIKTDSYLSIISEHAIFTAVAYLLNIFLVQVITITPINGDGNPTNGCSSAAMVRVAKATSTAKDISVGSTGNIVSTHPTSKTQAIITAEDTSSPGNVTAKVCS